MRVAIVNSTTRVIENIILLAYGEERERRAKRAANYIVNGISAQDGVPTEDYSAAATALAIVRRDRDSVAQTITDLRSEASRADTRFKRAGSGQRRHAAREEWRELMAQVRAQEKELERLDGELTADKERNRAYDAVMQANTYTPPEGRELVPVPSGEVWGIGGTVDADGAYSAVDSDPAPN